MNVATRVAMKKVAEILHDLAFEMDSHLPCGNELKPRDRTSLVALRDAAERILVKANARLKRSEEEG